jgi:hypothetical protein
LIYEKSLRLLTRQRVNLQRSLLIIVALVLAAVGGLGLMGTMGIDVLERTREIGVMRAVGAAARTILKIILFKGIFIGIISWLADTLFAPPLSKLISDEVGQRLLGSPRLVTPFLLVLKLIQGFQGLCAIHQRWAATHQDGDADSLGNVRLAGPGLQGVVHVIGNAAITTDGNGNPQRNQFLTLWTQGPLSYGLFMQLAEAGNRFACLSSITCS